MNLEIKQCRDRFGGVSRINVHVIPSELRAFRVKCNRFHKTKGNVFTYHARHASHYTLYIFLIFYTIMQVRTFLLLLN